MRFNAKGAFIGVVDDGLIVPLGPEAKQDTRTLSFRTFLAAPFLKGKFQKFSGSERAGCNGDTGVGAAMDAFAHHIIDDSQGHVILVDLQGMCIVFTLALAHVSCNIVGFLQEKELVLFDPQMQTLVLSLLGFFGVCTFQIADSFPISGKVMAL